MIIGSLLSIATLVAWVLLYEKMGLHGWAAIVPFYNGYVLFDHLYGNGWRFLLLFVPIVNIVIAILCFIDLAAKFNKSALFGLGLLFLTPIFSWILVLDK